jgi:hypothetical protein
MRKLVFIVAMSCVVAGCSAISVVGNQTGADAITDDLLKQRVARTLGVNANSVRISDRAEKGVETSFNAAVGKKSYSCYVTSVYLFPSGREVSDAICSRGGKATGAKDGGACNDLLKAAGKC